MKKKNLMIYAGVGTGFCLISLLSYSVVESSHASPATNAEAVNDSYPVINPVQMDTSYTTDYVAEIQAARYVSLKARVSGYLDKIHVDEGQHVTKGQLLFSLNPSEYEVNVLKTNAVLKSAIADVEAEKVEYNNVKELVAKNVVSATELEKEKAKLDALNAKVDECTSECANAKLNLAYTRITAPFDGIIGQIPNKQGSLIEEGTLLTNISDNSKVFAYFNVSEQEYLGLTHFHDNIYGQKVSLVLANQDLYPSEGTIESIDNNIDKGTGNITFRASFDNPGLLLKQGSTGKVRITNDIKNALIIPQKATFDVQDKTFVYTIGDNGAVKGRAIVPAFRLSNLYILSSGLNSSDKIIFEGLQKLKDGDIVNFTLVPFMAKGHDGQLVASSK